MRTAGATLTAGATAARRTAALAWVRGLPHALRTGWRAELDDRRLFLWLPVCQGAGIALYFAAEREPALWLTTLLTVILFGAAILARSARPLSFALVAVGTIAFGMAAAGWRASLLKAPVLDRIRIATLEGFVEDLDPRRDGARFVLRLTASDAFKDGEMPYRVRLTTRRTPDFDSGAYVALRARLLPPSRAAEPGGYDFARDAYFMRIGAVGSTLGEVAEAVPPEPPDWGLRIDMAIDRFRNGLARRVDETVGGDAGAIAAAMVTGKRDLLSEDAKAVIREAGIFHVITIAGVQMTLVAGIVYVGLRRLLALSKTLAENYPIKKWSAGLAIFMAIGYDVMTGSRVGTERALVMTLVLLTAVLCDRQALTMRNLAIAALIILAFQPEALLGASFQLSFAAVAALIAVWEHRLAHKPRDPLPVGPPRRGLFGRRREGYGWGHALISTFCATSATASFMAFDFHELNPYVLVGNPLTLAMIEIFAVPGAILGTFLYPLGLDGFVWHYIGWGIALIMGAARFIGSLPGSTLHLPSFALWSIVFLTLGVLSAVLWRPIALRLTALPWLAIGLVGAASGPSFDIAVAPLGEAMAVRGPDGHLSVAGRRPSAFQAEQWLRADADGRAASQAINKAACDKLGCVLRLKDGRPVALVLEEAAFAEDCLRASVVVTPLFAPAGCAAGTLIDRETLKASGAVTLKLAADGRLRERTARAGAEDRPWSPLPKTARWRANPPRHQSEGGDAKPESGDQ